MRPFLVALPALALLSACTAAPAVIADLESDKVVVQGGLGTSDQAILDKAQEGCGMHDRVARSLSTTCLDNYCIRKNVLFACVEN